MTINDLWKKSLLYKHQSRFILSLRVPISEVPEAKNKAERPLCQLEISFRGLRPLHGGVEENYVSQQKAN